MAQSLRSPDRWALLRIAAAELLVLTLWFSASAVGRQLQIVWGLSDGQVSGLTVAVQIGFVVGAVLIAVSGLADAIAPRRLFVGASVVGLLANAALVLLGPGDQTIAVILRIVTGAALAGVYPSGLAAMAGWFRSERGAALGILVAAVTLGSATPHLVRGLGLDWRGVVLASSAMAAVGAGLMGRLRPGPYVVRPGRFSIRQVRGVVANRRFRLATVGYMGHMWELYAMWTWTAAFLVASAAERGHAYGSIPLLTFFVVAVGAAGAWVAGRVSDRKGRAVAAGGSLIISGLAAVVTPAVFGGSVFVVVPLFLVWGFGVVADSAQFSVMATESVPDAIRGTALVLQTALGFLIAIVTIQGVPLLADVIGWRWAFLLLIPGPAVGVVAMARYRASIGTGRAIAVEGS